MHVLQAAAGGLDGIIDRRRAGVAMGIMGVAGIDRDGDGGRMETVGERHADMRILVLDVFESAVLQAGSIRRPGPIRHICRSPAGLAKTTRRTDIGGDRLPDLYIAVVAKGGAKVYRLRPQEKPTRKSLQEERDMMSNSFVNVHSGEETGDEAKRFFVLGERIERRLRIRGRWLNLFDVTVPPGSRTPRHAHASPEVFRILEGSLTIWRLTDSGPEEIEADAGDIVTIPPFMVHGYANRGTVPAVFSAVVDRDMAEFIEAEGATEPPKTSPSVETIARMTAAANAYGITILAA